MSQQSLWPDPNTCEECGLTVVDPVEVEDFAGLSPAAGTAIICKVHLDEYPGDFRRVDS